MCDRFPRNDVCSDARCSALRERSGRGELVAGGAGPLVRVGARAGRVGSVSARLLTSRGVAISTFGFEDEMMQALADRQIDAAAVSRAMAGYFASNHPQLPIRVLGLDAAEPQLTWTVSVGMMRPDAALRHAVDDALDRLRADGTVARIYAKYGITTEAPGP